VYTVTIRGADVRPPDSSATAVGGPLEPDQADNRKLLRLRIKSTFFRIWVHAVHLLSNILGDDVVSRHLRASLLRFAGARVGAGCIINGGTYISNPSNLRIGARVTINRNCYLDLEGPLVLGDFVGIGHGTTFITTIHETPSLITGSAITICTRAWIGANVTVMPGVNVGEHAIVSVGTILMRDVPPRCVVAGSPGRLVRRNV
jgi:acetyltransferase-like isoleucine patch superfamily enzyme